MMLQNISTMPVHRAVGSAYKDLGCPPENEQEKKPGK